MSTNTPPPTEPPATPAAEPAAPIAPPPPPAEPPTVAAKKRPSPILTGILGLVVGAGAVGGAWAYSNSGTDEPETFTLTGVFALTDSFVRTEGEHCQGRDGYDDIADGTSVTVYDADGGVAATGSIAKSKYSPFRCTFRVAVKDVPKGEKFYQVEVSHRGKVQLTAKEAEDGKLAASLG
ncbi:hypothetical protein [Streptomyces sp. NPDC086838]|uniref:hypothetical protein n=1 Tax=Streptomyces sp. NPDC086838 TaxID=3365762 RepID=UPI0037F61774